MNKLQWMLCGVLLAVVGCAELPTERAPVDELNDESDEVSVEARSVASGELLWPVSTNATTCTVTESACKRGQCELGANDRFSHIVETCCTDGVCTTTRIRLCGC
jgi:hypothetical protein